MFFLVWDDKAQSSLVIWHNYLRGLIPGFTYLWQILNFLFSFAIVTLLFGMIYKILPDAKIGWRDVWIGAGIAAVLFDLGKFLLSFYLGKTGLTSAYGAAGSLVSILTWVVYSAEILFLGAEFTQVYVKTYTREIISADRIVAVAKPYVREL
ncbi:YihY/virulence factor BrkB family protein [Aerosakkonema sp. BLCC-F183]|uniref:YihY/virulence factor BrkB family protein n=1 Tax=Aerosakkonema sp. BLCC-F183 TaxID=3342834 RepID=UPI0035B95405